MPDAGGMVFSVAVVKDGREGDRIPFEGERMSFGREAGCSVCLPDGSVSRRHGELVRTAAGVEIVDLGSRNGIRVNGVPRARAVLMPGDQFELGIHAFRLVAGPAAGRKAVAGAGVRAVPEAGLEQTVVGGFRLPEVRGERQLAAVFHAAFWLSECRERRRVVERLTRLMRECLGAEEAQFYSAGLEMEFRDGGAKMPLKLAEFLAKRFQGLPEAVVVEGGDVARHQRGAGGYQYLVGPLRRAEAAGACDFLVLMKPVAWEGFSTADRVLLQAVCRLWAAENGKAAAAAELARENRTLRQAAGGARGECLLGSSAEMEALRGSLRKVAVTKATVLLQGETGSGKEVVAQFLHENSPRAGKAFVKVNCAAIPDGLIESELFGHLRGAFTDARESRRGKFEQASGGTIFLDEIGEMPAAVQSKMLRVLETGEIEPLGGEEPRRVDVRVVAATHRDLAAMVPRREFREDLYFRLNVFAIRVPALREHPGDIGCLAAHFLESFCAENGLAALGLEGGALERLGRHSWPGNVRELRNVIQRAAITASGPMVTAAEIDALLA